MHHIKIEVCEPFRQFLLFVWQQPEIHFTLTAVDCFRQTLPEVRATHPWHSCVRPCVWRPCSWTSQGQQKDGPPLAEPLRTCVAPGTDHLEPYKRTKINVQAFFDFCSFHFRDFRFNAIYDSILFSSPLVLLSNLNLHGFCFPRFFFMCPHINSVNPGMPVVCLQFVGHIVCPPYLVSIQFQFKGKGQIWIRVKCLLVFEIFYETIRF